MSPVVPPWTDRQVASLNAYQASAGMHPFTCGNDECRREYGEPLFATPSGWVCPHCPYRQWWAHEWMTDGSWAHPNPAQAYALLSTVCEPGPVPAGSAWLQRWEAARPWVQLAIARHREEQDRAEWVGDVKRRLGLVTAEDRAGPEVMPWNRAASAGWPDPHPVQWHRPAAGAWMAQDGCRCVILAGERLPAGCPVHDRPWSDLEISNCDPGIPAGLKDDLRAGMVTHHNGWHFNGHVWYDEDAMLFREEVFRFHVSQGVWSARSLTTLVRAVNDRFGWD